MLRELFRTLWYILWHWYAGIENDQDHEDIIDAVENCRRALAQCPKRDGSRASALLNLANALQSRSTQEGDMDDLLGAVELYREALALSPSGHINRPISLKSLGKALWTKFYQTGEMDDLDEAITCYHDSLALTPKDSPGYSMSLDFLAEVLMTRFEWRGQQEDLDEAIYHYRDALALYPEGHPDRSASFNSLANALRTRFEQRGQEEDLDEAICHYRDALALRPEGHLDSDESTSPNNLANALMARFEKKGQQEDLDEAIRHHRDALALFPEGHPFRSGSLNNLAFSLQRIFEQRGQEKDLDEAICHLRDALALCPEGNPDRSMSFNNLANSLWTRFEHRGQQEDLDEAIRYHRDALPLFPEGHPIHSSSLNNLANVLRTRFEQRGQQEDLDEAICHHRDALALVPKGHPNRSMSLNNLATALQTHFEQKGQQEDLDEAIRHHREALALFPEAHPDRSMSFNSLGNALQTRFEQTGQEEDLDEAIRHLRDALALHPEGHSFRSASINNLTKALLKKMELHAGGSVGSPSPVRTPGDKAEVAIHADSVESMLPVDREYVISLLENAVKHEFSNLKDRLNASFTWIRAARQLGHESMPRAYSASLELLARISAQRSTLESQHKSFSSTFYHIPKSFVSDAASSAIELGMIDTAVEFLEQGRAFLWTRMKSYRHPLLQLCETHPELVKRFEELGAKLERHATAPAVESSARLEAQWQEYWRLSKDWKEVVEEIRNVDGFQDFLKPPRFSTLRKAAAGGPVILINVSEYRSDAIIISDINDPVVVPLPRFTPKALEDLVSRFLQARASDSQGFSSKLQVVLRELWELVVEPVAEHLKSLNLEPKSRIWWCPTSKLCALPLHAAGPYSAKNKSLPDLYVSSYTPTLTALISARENSRGPNETTPRLLVVGEHDQGTIPAVEEEVRRLKDLGPFVEVLTGEAVSRSNVIQALETHTWSHFACHGKISPVPFHSSFKLHNGQRLELLELIKARLPNAELAFLSACHAAAVDVKETPDEVIHLSAAMQFCGFRSVVGTLWAMADEDGPDVSKDFYKYMFRDLEAGRVDFRDAATALNLATREMRKKRIPLSRWVNFVHIGA